jgi:hypothetical protein
MFVLLSLLSSPPAHAGEGMWEPAQLPSLAAELRSAGFVGDAEVLADLHHAPLAAVASLGGCTASFVSDRGLLVTNHHCALSMAQRAQREGEQLATDGFYAPTEADERPTGGSTRVWVTQGFEDVTDRVVGRLSPRLDDRARHDAIDAAQKRLVAACERAPGTSCRVAAYDEGARYLLVRSLELRDVRLVMVPPDMVGNYGDEVDNWHWPRHAGDFAFLRAYGTHDGKPADFSPDNVPWQPAHHLQVSPRGVAPGEFVMLAGYPGSTARWRTAADLEAEVWQMRHRIEEGGWVFDLLTAAMAADPGVVGKLTRARSGIGNGVFKAKGMLASFERSGAVARQADRDARLDAWVAADPGRRERYAASIAELRERIRRHEATRERDFYMGWLGRSDLLATARGLYRWSLERQRPDAQRRAGYQARDEARARSGFESLDAGLHLPTDRALVERMLGRLLALPAEQQPAELVAWLRATTPGAEGPALVEGALRRLYDAPVLADRDTRLAWFDRGPDAFRTSPDGFLSLAVALQPWDAAREAEADEESGAIARVRPVFASALRAFDPARAAADANGTLRVSFGTVRGYAPQEAVTYGPQTSVHGLAAKAGAWPFAAPPALLAAIAAGKWGAWADPTLGAVPVDFLSDVDITGGNSGSPTLDARGRLVGLAFDTNYEGVASDWVVDAPVTRAIHVDIRYVLWYLDTVAQAPALVRELGMEPSR